MADALSRLPQHGNKADPVVDTVFSPSQLGLAVVTQSQVSARLANPGAGLQAGLGEDPEFPKLKPDLQLVDGVFVKGANSTFPKPLGRRF